MKRIIYIFVVMLMAFVHDHIAYALTSYEQSYLEKLTPPEVSDLFRAHMADVSLYTGKMNLSVPLYELQDPDFPLIVSLDYNAEGFKPRKHSGVVGYNWALNAGGFITREVNGKPDETTIRRTGINFKGMLSFFYHETPSPDSVFALSQTVLQGNGKTFKRAYGGTEYYIDYQPDIFHFDFCGYHGAFMINNSGTATLVNGDFVDIDLSGLDQTIEEYGTSFQSLILDNVSHIKIRTLDGYLYEFGGNLSSICCNVALLKNSTNHFATTSPVINTWHLNKITAPNGRSVSFFYKPVSGSNLGITSPLWLYNEEYIKPAPYENISENNVYLCYGPRSGGSFDLLCLPSATKECILDSIRVSGPSSLKITLNNGLESENMYPIQRYNLTNGYSLATHNYQLNSIQVYSNGRVLKNITFSYETKKGESDLFSWRFLKNMSIYGQGTYQFNYNHAIYPNPNLGYYYLCYDLDGYWNDNYLAGLLTKIEYPTGGWQTFTYERHSLQYCRRYYREINQLTQQYTGNVVCEKRPNTHTFNGARIRQIQTYNNSGELIEKKEYTYEYGVYYDKKTMDIWDGVFVVDNLCGYSIDNSPVGYPRVQEKIYSPQNNLLSSTDYIFAQDGDYSSSSASLHIESGRENQSGNYNWDNYFYEAARFLMFSDRILTVGKLVEKNIFLNQEYLESDYLYYNNSVGSFISLHPQPIIQQTPGDTIVIYNWLSDSTAMSRRLYTYPDVLTQKTTCSYNGNNKLFTTEAYYHDTKQRVTKKITYDGNGREYFTMYKYPDQLQASRISNDVNIRALFLLKKKQQISQPVEVYSGFTSQNNEHVISGSITRYYTDMPYLLNNPTPWTSYHVYPNQEYSLFISSPITNYLPMTCDNGIILCVDSRYKLVKTTTYDDYLRPITITPVGGPTTTYSWDGFYPDTVTVGTHMTTYTNTPHVGITSVTDPKGLTTYYSYDSYGRLVEVYQKIEGVKHVLQSYHYHISNE